MRRLTVWFCVTALSMVSATAYAQKGSCQSVDIPIVITIAPLVDGGTNYGVLNGDSKGRSYTDGVDGVGNAVIHLCSGSYDATLNVGNKRTMQITFGQALSVDNGLVATVTPIWVGSTIVVKPAMNVRDLMWGRRNGTASFTTWMMASNIIGPGDRSEYGLRFKASGTNAPENPLFDSIPGTVPVTVAEYSSTACSGGTKDTWSVTTLTTGLSYGGLFRRSDEAFAGYYDMPLRLFITTKNCVNWSQLGLAAPSATP